MTEFQAENERLKMAMDGVKVQAERKAVQLEQDLNAALLREQAAAREKQAADREHVRIAAELRSAQQQLQQAVQDRLMLEQTIERLRKDNSALRTEIMQLKRAAAGPGGPQIDLKRAEAKLVTLDSEDPHSEFWTVKKASG